MARALIVLIAFLLFLPLTTAAKDGPLVITGSVVEIDVAGPMNRIQINKDDPREGYRFERAETWFEVMIQLKYCNRGEEKLIVPLRTAFPNEMTKVLFLNIPSTNSSPAATVIGRASRKHNDFVESFVRNLRSSFPYGFTTIDADTCVEAFDKVSIPKGFLIESLKNPIKNQPDIEFIRPEYQYFKLQYSFSLKDSKSVAEAKERWKRFGKLLTSGDGNFFFETDVIVNKLPD